MNGNRFLADTNTLIYLLDKTSCVAAITRKRMAFSFITEIELPGKPGISSAEVNKVRGLLSVCIKAPHTEAINSTPINLKQSYKMKVPYAIIAATAIEQSSFVNL